MTQAGKASLPYDHPQMVNALGASGSVFANALANQADLIIGIGTRYTDFTTASNTMFSTRVCSSSTSTSPSSTPTRNPRSAWSAMPARAITRAGRPPR